MTLDSQGSLHVVWLDQSEEVPVTPRQAWVPRERLLHTKLSGDGQSYQETREIPYGRVMAAFVLQDGEVYVVSQQRVLETTRPVSTSNPLAPVLALVPLSIVASGMSTETGTYLVASWAGHRLVVCGTPDEGRICRSMRDSSQKNRGATRSDPVRPEAPEPSQHKGRCGAPPHP